MNSREYLEKNSPDTWEVVAPRDRDDYEIKVERPGQMAGLPKPMLGARRLRSCWNYNGSGEKAFGGANKWPALDLHISFPVGRPKLRDQLVVALAKFTDEWLAKRGL